MGVITASALSAIWAGGLGVWRINWTHPAPEDGKPPMAPTISQDLPRRHGQRPAVVEWGGLIGALFARFSDSIEEMLIRILESCLFQSPKNRWSSPATDGYPGLELAQGELREWRTSLVGW